MDSVAWRTLFALLVLASAAELSGQEPDPLMSKGRPVSYWIGELARGEPDPDLQFMGQWRGQSYAAFEAFDELRAQAVPALVEALEHDSAVVRHNAAEVLGRMGPEAKDAVPALAECLDDEDLQVRKRAVDSLGRIGPDAEAAIPKLAELLGDTQQHFVPPHGFWRLSAEARDALRQIGDESLPVFIENLSHVDATLRWEAAEALGTFPHRIPRVLPELVRALDDPNPVVRACAAEAIGKLGPEAESATLALAQRLQDWGEVGEGLMYSSHVAAKASDALRQIRPRRLPRHYINNALLPVAENSDESFYRTPRSVVRWEMMILLAESGSAVTAPVPILESAQNDRGLRGAALITLAAARPGDAGAREKLLSRLNDLGDDEALVALKVLQRIGAVDDSTVQTLAALQNENPAVRLVAASLWLKARPADKSALARLQACVGPALDELYLDYSDDVRRWSAVLSVLRESEVVGRQALPLLVEKVKSGWGDEHVLEAFEAIPSDKRDVLPDLLMQLENKSDSARRRAAALALGRLGEPVAQVTWALVAALQDRRLEVRLAAASSLGRMKITTPDVLPGLTGLLKSEYVTLQLRGLESLGQLGTSAESSLPLVEDLSKSHSASVRNAVARVREQISTRSK